MSAAAYRSIVTPQFRKMLNDLPERVQQEAREGFERWKTDPRAVGWKPLAGMHAQVHSVEIGRRYRAIGVVDKAHNAVVWVFAGSHETYNRYIESHRKLGLRDWVPPSITDRLTQRRAGTQKAHTHGSPKPQRSAPA